MIPTQDVTASVIESGGYVMRTRVRSVRGENTLMDSVPITSAVEEADSASAVPEYVNFTVPRLYDGESMDPTGDDDHPLAANGQRLVCEVGIEIGPDGIDWLSMGEFVIHDTEPQGESVQVSAAGLLYLTQEARFVSPYQPSGTLASTLRNLIEPNITVFIDDGLTDRSIASGISWDEDRLAAVYQIADDWPARIRMHEDGYVIFEPAIKSTTPVRTLTDGYGGTVIEVNGQSTREGAYNTFIAEGTDSAGAIVRGISYDYTGPKGFGGPFNAQPVPFTHYSPILTTQNAANQAAVTLRDRKKLETALELKATIIPDPRLQLGDVVAVNTDRFTNAPFSIWSYRKPYTPGDGAMELTLREIR